MEQQLLTVKEIQSALRLGHTRIYELINSGEIETFKIGRRRMATAEALDKFIKRQQQDT